jgi:hypothetical protein
MNGLGFRGLRLKVQSVDEGVSSPANHLFKIY